MPSFPPTNTNDPIMCWFTILPIDEGEPYSIPFPKNTTSIHSNNYLEDLTDKIQHMLATAPSPIGAVPNFGDAAHDAASKPPQSGEAFDFQREIEGQILAGNRRLGAGSVYQSPDLTDLVFYKSNKRTLNVQARLMCATQKQSEFCKILANVLQIYSLPSYTQAGQIQTITPPSLFKILASVGSNPATVHDSGFFPAMTECVLEELKINTLGHSSMHISQLPLQYHISMIFREKAPVYHVNNTIKTRNWLSSSNSGSGGP